MGEFSLWSGEEEGKSPGDKKSPPGAVHRRSVGNREDDCRKPFQEDLLPKLSLQMFITCQ